MCACSRVELEALPFDFGVTAPMFITSILNAFNAFNHPKKTSKLQRKRAKKRLLRMECLEGRRVFDASFDSLITVGNDTSPIAPSDNAVDIAGNNYVTGVLYGEMDMDPSVDRADRSDVLIPRGSSDAFLVKYDPSNRFLWARRMGSDYLRSTNANDPFEKGNNLAVDASGNVYLTGDFAGQADFGLFQLTALGSTDAFVTKLDTNGNFLWARSWGSTSRDFGSGIAVDNGGNVLAVGSTTFLSSNGAWTANGAEIRKYSPSGSLTWSKSIAGWGMGAGRVATDSAANVYVGGGFAGTVDFNPDPKKSNTATGSPVVSGGSGVNAYVLKLASTGTYIAVAPLVAKTQEVSTAYVGISDLAIDASDSVVIGGDYRGPTDFNPSSLAEYRLPSISTTFNGFVEKLSPNLSFAWATMLDGGRISALAIDYTGIYAVGSFRSTVVFAGTSFTTNGGSDVIVAKWNSSGTQEWALAFGGTRDEDGRGIAVDSAGTLSIVGTYYGSVDFDPDPLTSNIRTNAAWADMYLLKLRRR